VRRRCWRRRNCQSQRLPCAPDSRVRVTSRRRSAKAGGSDAESFQSGAVKLESGPQKGTKLSHLLRVKRGPQKGTKNQKKTCLTTLRNTSAPPHLVLSVCCRFISYLRHRKSAIEILIELLSGHTWIRSVPPAVAGGSTIRVQNQSAYALPHDRALRH
jgi:hypothetical protein